MLFFCKPCKDLQRAEVPSFFAEKEGMKIQYASDLHLEFAENKEYLRTGGISPVVDVLIV